MNLIDSHCHINSKELLPNVNEIVERANKSEVKNFIIVGCDLDDSILALNLAYKFNQYASIGIHPHEAEKYLNIPEEFYKLICDQKIIAVGEIGLDFHYMNSPKDVQIKFFIAQLNFAREFKKPVILHIREAMPEALEILKDYSDLKLLFHCYSGGLEFLERVLNLGGYCALGGALTWKNSAELREVIKNIPIEKLLFETDCPYMSPVPLRGKINEPANIKYVYEKASEILKIDLNELTERIKTNVINFFNIKLN